MVALLSSSSSTDANLGDNGDRMESRVRACFTPTTVSYERARGGCLLFPDALNTTGACDNAKRASATSSASGWRRDNEALAARSGNSGTCVVVSLSVSAPIAVVSPSKLDNAIAFNRVSDAFFSFVSVIVFVKNRRKKKFKSIPNVFRKLSTR